MNKIKIEYNDEKLKAVNGGAIHLLGGLATEATKRKTNDQEKKEEFGSKWSGDWGDEPYWG